jgi:hypothetical protein
VACLSTSFSVCKGTACAQAALLPHADGLTCQLSGTARGWPFFGWLLQAICFSLLSSALCLHSSLSHLGCCSVHCMSVGVDGTWDTQTALFMSSNCTLSSLCLWLHQVTDSYQALARRQPELTLSFAHDVMEELEFPRENRAVA